MNSSHSVFRWVQESAEALARLDAVVGVAPSGVGSLLMLRTAHEIASRVRPDLSGAGAFAALLGWWYAAESREFVSVPLEMRAVALALDAAAGKVRSGRALTPLLVEEIAADVRGGGVAAATLPAIEDALRRARVEAWPVLLLSATLATGDCAAADTATTMIARAIVPIAGGLVTDAFIAPAIAADHAEALQGIAVAARDVLPLVRNYRRAGHAASEQVGAFGRGAPTARALLDLMVGAPAVTVLGASEALGVSVPSTGAAVQRLLGAGLLREITGRGRDRVFVYEPAIALAG